MSIRELEESPKGASESVPRPFNDAQQDMHEVSDHCHAYQDIDDRPSATLQFYDGNLVHIPDGTTVDTSRRVVDGEMNKGQAHESVPLQRQEVHPSKNIQHGLELWERIREYDARSALEAAATTDNFVPVLTRNQKKKLKLQTVLSKKSSKSRAQGDNQTHAQ